MPVLPNVTSRFVFDYSDLTKAEKASAKAHGEFQAGAKASTTHNLRFEQSLTTLMDHFGGMPPIVNQAGRSIESMASQGVSGMTMLGGAALVAVGAVAEVVGQSIKSYTELGDKVENYKRVVGSSAEESGRMVQTFQAPGVSEETATNGMFKLSKAVDQHPAKLAALGVEVAHQKDGNVDLSKTLFNVADAYNAAGDQAKKNAILLLAFGKSGKDMIPILEQGSVALRQLEDSARMVFTQEDLDRLKQTEIHNREVTQSWNEMWASLGQKLIPAQDALSVSFLRGEYVQKRMSEAMQAGKITQDDWIHANEGSVNVASRLQDELGKQYDASLKVKSAFDAQAQATKDLTAANEQEWASADKLITQQEAEVNAGFALEQANLAVTESQAKVNQAQDAYEKAVKTYGASSDEALLAAGNLTRAQIDQEKSYYAGAAAARKLQQDTDLATGGQKDATKETEAYITKLQAEADTLAPTSPLRNRLQEYIDKLKNEIPAEVSTKFLVDFQASVVHLSGRAGGNVGYAEGGRPPVGVPSLIGEKGAEIWTPDVPGTITPHGQTPPAAPAAGGGMTILPVVFSPIPPSREQMLAVRDQLRALQREQL